MHTPSTPTRTHTHTHGACHCPEAHTLKLFNVSGELSKLSLYS